MRNCLLLVLFFACSSTAVSAQGYIYGKTIDSATRKIIDLATITNLSKGRSVVSDDNGRFTIMVEEGDRVIVSCSGYDYVNIIVNSEMMNDTMTVKLNVLSAILPEAIVSAKSEYSRYQIDSMQRRLQHRALVKPTEKTIGGPANGSGFGISINLDRYSKQERQSRQARDLFDIIEEEAYINSRFTKEDVTMYTGMKGEGVVEFMNLYRPKYDWLRLHDSQEDIIGFINKRIKLYRKIPGNKLKNNS